MNRVAYLYNQDPLCHFRDIAHFREFLKFSLFHFLSIYVPAHEVVFAPLVLVPHRDLHLLTLLLKQVQIELLHPLRVQGLVNGLRFVAVVAQS